MFDKGRGGVGTTVCLGCQDVIHEDPTAKHKLCRIPREYPPCLSAETDVETTLTALDTETERRKKTQT